MNWFSGRLDIAWVDGTNTSLYDVSFTAACAFHEANAERIRAAMYHPYPTEVSL